MKYKIEWLWDWFYINIWERITDPIWNYRHKRMCQKYGIWGQYLGDNPVNGKWCNNWIWWKDEKGRDCFYYAPIHTMRFYQKDVETIRKKIQNEG